MAYLYQVVSIKNDKHEEKKNLSLTIHSQRWGTMWVDHVCQPQLATCGQLINLALFKWPQIWHKRAQSHAKWCLHHALPISLEIFRKFVQKLKFKGYINLWNIDRPYKTAFQHHVKHVIVWCRSHCDHKTPFGPHLKVSYTIHKL